MAALAAAGPRYVGALAVVGIAPPLLEGLRLGVLERLAGSAATDFGAPGAAAAAEDAPLGASEARRRASIVGACWAALERTAAAAPAELRKGPRGGGRDRDAIVSHVLAAERSYAAKIGLRLPASGAGALDNAAALRAALAEALGTGVTPIASRWSLRYAARRIGWHALDHAWEIEDRGPAAG